MSFPSWIGRSLEWAGVDARAGAPNRASPVDLGRLSTIVAAAIDPTVARPPAVERVLSTLPGITHIGPVEIEPELDLPLWSFLSTRSPDWMLPAQAISWTATSSALSTNPAFVESLLVGANHQATAELRWRNVPLVTRWSPLRKFWQRKAKDSTSCRSRPWPAAAALGSAALGLPGRGAEAVVVFRTSLFRRYPATVVYLYPRQDNWTPPDRTNDLDREPHAADVHGNDRRRHHVLRLPGAPVRRWRRTGSCSRSRRPGYRFYHKTATPPARRSSPSTVPRTSRTSASPCPCAC